VIAVSFLAAVQERRREFGIMSSIGLADEVLYFFLVESGIVFLTAYLSCDWRRSRCGAGDSRYCHADRVASGLRMVAAFVPAMAIVGALVTGARLLNNVRSHSWGIGDERVREEQRAVCWVMGLAYDGRCTARMAKCAARHHDGHGCVPCGDRVRHVDGIVHSPRRWVTPTRSAGPSC